MVFLTLNKSRAGVLHAYGAIKLIKIARVIPLVALGLAAFSVSTLALSWSGARSYADGQTGVTTATSVPKRVTTPQVTQGAVAYVVDGDTVWVKTSANQALVKVRMVGIDAPESCQTGGAASRDALAARLSGQTVTLIASSSRAHDDYGRLLAKVDLNGEDMGRWMVSQGHAWSYGYRNYLGPYAAEQTQAQATERGLFADAAAENPRDFRKRHGSCSVLKK